MKNKKSCLNPTTIKHRTPGNPAIATHYLLLQCAGFHCRHWLFRRSSHGREAKIVAGVLFIFFGLVTLQLLPIRISLFKQNKKYSANSFWSAILFGIILASSSIVCNAICNPVFSLTLGTVFLQNNVLWGSLILLMFGLGFGLPLAMGMAGLSLGLQQISSRMDKIALYIKYGGGALLLVIGFYFLLTF